MQKVIPIRNKCGEKFDKDFPHIVCTNSNCKGKHSYNGIPGVRVEWTEATRETIAKRIRERT